MIGLSANRLNPSRLAGLGEWGQTRCGQMIEGYGSWGSPYSAAATRALKAAFSAAQWATIRDYGLEHPEIVGYMNAYAVEDAKIAYSLVPTLGVIRYIRGGGNNAYFVTNITMPNMADFVEAKFKRTAINTYHTIYGSYSGNDRSYDILMSEGSAWWYGNGVTLRRTGTYLTNHHYDFKLEYTGGRAITTIDGVETWNDNASQFIEGTVPFFIFARNLQGTADCFADNNNYIESIEWRKNGSSLAWYVPFIRNGVLELLDLVSGQLAERHGSFTESIDSPS